jgi:hypothetical protein
MDTFASQGCRGDLMTSADAAQLYLDRALQQIPRSISLQDREPFSRTRGCFDRTYWAWKFVDFPGARYQEGIYPLAFLHSVADGGQGYLANPRVLEWIEAGLDYWTTLQYRDGSFDEAYPFERSLAATAFTGFYVAESVRVVRASLRSQTFDRTRDALLRLGRWLERNDETHGFLSNHLAAAAGALVHIGQLFDEPRFLHRGRYFLNRVLSHQSSEGWYDEYGGADPGYQTHATFYLARIWQLTGDDDLFRSLDRSVEFVSHFVHPDGTLGGEYGSRNTQFYYPAGLEILAGSSEAARWVAGQMAESIRRRQVASLETMDAQNFYPLLNNYLFAWQAAAARDPALPAVARTAPPAQRVEFPQAGVIKVTRPAYELIVGVSKGGVLKLFDRRAGRLLFSDCGYVGRSGDASLIASQSLDRSRRAEVGDDRITLDVQFSAVKRSVFRPLSFLVFRLVTLTLGRLPRFAQWMKSLLVKVLIHRRQAVPLVLRRTVVLGVDAVEVRDFLKKSGSLSLESLRRVDIFSTVHMGSSRYFQPNELNLAEEPFGDAGESVAVDRLAEGVELSRTIRLAVR